MAQISLYIDDATLKEARAHASGIGKSLSSYVGDLIKHDLKKSWPPGFFDLYGASDDPAFVEPEEIPWRYDSPRPWDGQDES